MADIKTLADDLRGQANAALASLGTITQGNPLAANYLAEVFDILDVLTKVHQAEVARLTRENEGLAKDAARYRWLRYQIQTGPLTIAECSEWELMGWCGDNPDLHIDRELAAIAQADQDTAPGASAVTDGEAQV